MTPYILLIFLGLCFVLFPKRADKTTMFLYSALILFIACFRDISIGTDNYGYYYKLSTLGYDNLKMLMKYGVYEPGMIYLYYYLNSFGAANYVPAAIQFVILYSGIVFLSKRYSIRPVASIFFFVILGYFFISLNIIRQFTCIGLILFLIPLLERGKKQKIKYFIAVILISLSIHKSGLFFLIPLLIVIFKDKFPNNSIPYVFILALSLIGSQASNYIAPKIGVLLQFSEYDSYVTSDGFVNHDNGFRLIMSQSFICIVYLFYTKKKNNLPFLLYFSGAVMFNILQSFSTAAARITYGFSLFSIIYFVNILYTLPYGFKRTSIYVLTICYYLFYTYTMFLIGNSGEIIPYKFAL